MNTKCDIEETFKTRNQEILATLPALSRPELIKLVTQYIEVVESMGKQIDKACDLTKRSQARLDFVLDTHGVGDRQMKRFILGIVIGVVISVLFVWLIRL